MKYRIVYANPNRFYIGDAEVTEEEFKAATYTRDQIRLRQLLEEHGAPGVPGEGWPLVSEALAVHPKQVKQANDRARRHGISVEYLPDGRVKIPSRHERAKLLRLEGRHDKSGGYGDG